MTSIVKRKRKLDEEQLRESGERLSIFHELVAQVVCEVMRGYINKIEIEHSSSLEEIVDNCSSIIANLVDEVKQPFGSKTIHSSTRDSIDAMRRHLNTQQKEYQRDVARQRNLDNAILCKGHDIWKLKNEIDELAIEYRKMEKKMKRQRGAETDSVLRWRTKKQLTPYNLIESSMKKCNSASNSRPKKKVSFREDVIFDRQSPSSITRRVRYCSCSEGMAKKVATNVARLDENHKTKRVNAIITDYINAMTDAVIQVCKGNGQVRQLANAKNHMNEIVAAKFQSELDKFL